MVQIAFHVNKTGANLVTQQNYKKLQFLHIANWGKLAKIGENWRKLAKIGENCRKLSKIVENCENCRKLSKIGEKSLTF